MRHGTYIGDNRNQRIPERMFKNSFQLGHTLCSGCTDIVLSQNIQHTALGQTCDIRHGVSCQGNYRKKIILIVRTPHRNPFQSHTEYQKQQRSEHEAWQRRKQGGKENDQPVRKMISCKRCKTPKIRPSTRAVRIAIPPSFAETLKDSKIVVLMSRPVLRKHRNLHEPGSSYREQTARLPVCPD